MKENISLPWSMTSTLNIWTFFYYVFGIFLIFTGLMSVHRSATWSIGFFLLPISLLLFRTAYQKIGCSREGIKCLNTIFPSKLVLWKDVESVKIPFMTKLPIIEIYEKGKPSFFRGAAITVNYKFFSGKDISDFIYLIHKEAPQAQLDGRAQDYL